MAIDSAKKRKSVSGVPFLPFAPGVTPNASPDSEWRAQAAWGYSGVFLAGGTQYMQSLSATVTVSTSLTETMTILQSLSATVTASVSLTATYIAAGAEKIRDIIVWALIPHRR